MMFRRVIIVATLIAVFPGAPKAQDFWGRMLPDQPTQFIFGYGSLVNTASRNSTATKSVSAIPVRVSAAFGYIRMWNDHSPSGFTALGLRRPDQGETAMTINGVVYPVEGDDMSAFDVAERGYVRVEVPHEDIEAVSWQGLPRKAGSGSMSPSRPGQRARVGSAAARRRITRCSSRISTSSGGRPGIWPGVRAGNHRDHKDWSRLLVERSRPGTPAVGVRQAVRRGGPVALLLCTAIRRPDVPRGVHVSKVPADEERPGSGSGEMMFAASHARRLSKSAPLERHPCGRA